MKDSSFGILIALLMIMFCLHLNADDNEEGTSGYDATSNPWVGPNPSTPPSPCLGRNALHYLPPCPRSSTLGSVPPDTAIYSRAPGYRPAFRPKEAGIQWSPLLKGSLFYLGVTHSFRIATGLRATEFWQWTMEVSAALSGTPCPDTGVETP
jgi:hypothetical protein